MITRWGRKIDYFNSGVQLVEFTESHTPDLIGTFFSGQGCVLAIENVFSALISITKDHGSIIARIPCYVNGKKQVYLTDELTRWQMFLVLIIELKPVKGGKSELPVKSWLSGGAWVRWKALNESPADIWQKSITLTLAT